MSLQIAKNEQSFARPSHAMYDAQDQDKGIKVLIPYDGSESAEMAFTFFFFPFFLYLFFQL